MGVGFGEQGDAVWKDLRAHDVLLYGGIVVHDCARLLIGGCIEDCNAHAVLTGCLCSPDQDHDALFCEALQVGEVFCHYCSFFGGQAFGEHGGASWLDAIEVVFCFCHDVFFPCLLFATFGGKIAMVRWERICTSHPVGDRRCERDEGDASVPTHRPRRSRPYETNRIPK